MDSQQETQEEPGHGTAQAFSNCLNPILALVSMPLHFLAFAAAGAGMLLTRWHNTMDFCGIEAAFLMLEDGLSGYLLFGGLVMAGIALKLMV